MKTNRVFSNLNGNSVLKTNNWSISIVDKRGHLHCAINGPSGYKKSGLTSIKGDLTQFESKAVLLYLFAQARYQLDCGNEKVAFDLTSINFADIFGSCFD